jgi:hypothetical protein
MSNLQVHDKVKFIRNPGSPLQQEAVKHIGQTAEVVKLFTCGYHIRFSDGYSMNAFEGELTKITE